MAYTQPAAAATLESLLDYAGVSEGPSRETVKAIDFLNAYADIGINADGSYAVARVDIGRVLEIAGLVETPRRRGRRSEVWEG